MGVAGQRWVRAAAMAGAAVIGACAGGDSSEGTFGPGGIGENGTTADSNATVWPPPSDDDKDGVDTFGSSTSGGEGAEDSPATPPDLGTCGGKEDCVIEGDGCFEAQGVCADGSCTFAAKPAGILCDDADPCTQADVCNGMGGCLGVALPCEVPNGSAACEGGQCGALICDAQFADCNGDPTDGCETALGSAQACAGCGDVCAAGPHATGACTAGACAFSCDAPYENCDGDWANGCEIPTGIPNQCDANGLNPTSGCWTAHCGNSANADAVNFGDWYCFECTTCHVPSAGRCQWCSHDTGTWFPSDTCACGGFQDLTCG